MGADSDVEPAGAWTTRVHGARVDLGETGPSLGLICKAPNGTDSHLAPVGSEGRNDCLLSNYYVPGTFFLIRAPPTPHQLLILQICYISVYILYECFIH